MSVDHFDIHLVRFFTASSGGTVGDTRLITSGKSCNTQHSLDITCCTVHDEGIYGFVTLQLSVCAFLHSFFILYFPPQAKSPLLQASIMVRSGGFGPVATLEEVIAGEEDETTFSLSHPKHVPLFSSPLESPKPDHGNHGDTLLKQPQHSSRATSGDHTPLSLEEKPEHRDPDEPVLKKAHESSVIQLFYDLFFVANLTTFTEVHAINDAGALRSYIGFFSVLWFTWLQVALFDVRFSNDSAFERLCKLLQFGVMTGLAVVGPGFNTGTDDSEAEAKTFRTLSLVLMASRLILAAQYGIVFWWTSNFKKARIPLLAHVATLFVAAMIFLGLFFFFKKGAGVGGLVAWYIIIAFEALVILLVSGRAKFLSFRRTPLIERLGLLTLIILGEGVIGLCGSIRKVNSDGVFTSDTIGLIICGVGIIYFLWMLYFDQIESERVGTMRQQFWTLLHFPFHICVLLVVEGVSQLSVWRKIVDVSNNLANTISLDLSSANNITGGLANVNETLQGVFNSFKESEFTLPDLQSNFDAVMSAGDNQTEISDNIQQIVFATLDWVIESLDVKVPEGVKNSGEENAALAGAITTFETVFFYFFIAAGLTLILLAALFFLGKRRKSRGEYLSIGLRVIVGLALALVSIMGRDMIGTNATGPNGVNFFFSAWMLPTVLLTYGMGESSNQRSNRTPYKTLANSIDSDRTRQPSCQLRSKGRLPPCIPTIPRLKTVMNLMGCWWPFCFSHLVVLDDLRFLTRAFY